jgi:hypothetical protein
MVQAACQPVRGVRGTLCPPDAAREEQPPLLGEDSVMHSFICSFTNLQIFTGHLLFAAGH